MSQVDNRNSSASKRARTDGSRREDDWTCPSCGNVNFSFRTTCNMRNCTQSRPADHNMKTAKPPQAPQGFTSSAPYMGVGGASSMYLGMAPYGSSLFNGTSVPPYNVPFSGGSGYPYDYANRLSAGGPYGPMMSGPNPYSAGSVMGAGGMYGMPSLMDRYGMGLPMVPGVMGARPGPYADDNSQKRGADGMRESDWTCPKCGNVNFAFRTVCNMRKCGTPKPGSQSKGGKADNAKGSKSSMPEGSWKCEKCNNINYPFRTKCNRQNCGAEKPSEANKSPRSATDEEEPVSTRIPLRDERSRVIIGVAQVWVSESQSCVISCSGCQVSSPSHDPCLTCISSNLGLNVDKDCLVFVDYILENMCTTITVMKRSCL